uniref:Lipase domain-containing protein n=1 Tax=Timema tahoe TaxID=61484 RepID=A0A7R9IAZ8_9NEOP|nr:unnamed protein product [Timema tahoe]
MMSLASRRIVLLFILILLTDHAKLSVGNPIQPATQDTGVANIGSCHWVFKKTCPDINVRFYLYTGTHPDTPEELTLGEEGNWTGSSFDPTHPTKIIIHGFASDMNLVHLVKIRTGYLSTGPHNIVAVDWSYYSKGPWFCYPVAVANIRHTGQCVAQLIEALRGAGCEDIHLVGFSLGAHVPAFTANYMRPYQIPRITGLDPAMPLFESRSKDSKLDAGDALFVDIVHTNAFMQGKFERCGHVDFYMNGGVSQPGCYSDGVLLVPSAIDIRGYYIVETSSQSPYALGEWTGPLMPSS